MPKPDAKQARPTGRRSGANSNTRPFVSRACERFGEKGHESSTTKRRGGEEKMRLSPAPKQHTPARRASTSRKWNIFGEGWRADSIRRKSPLRGPVAREPSRAVGAGIVRRKAFDFPHTHHHGTLVTAGLLWRVTKRVFLASQDRGYAGRHKRNSENPVQAKFRDPFFHARG